MGINRYIAEQFSNPHGLGGKLIFAIMNRQNRPMYEETERLLSLSLSDHVLDIGCGNGYVLNMLAQRHSCMFKGIDISESMVKTAMRRNSKFLKDNIMDISSQSVEAMSFANNSFDKAYSINTVYFWNNLAHIMAEIHRVIKPGGLFINTLYSNASLNQFSHTQFGYKQFTIEQIGNASENAGFQVEPVSVMQGAAICVICKKCKTP